MSNSEVLIEPGLQPVIQEPSLEEMLKELQNTDDSGVIFEGPKVSAQQKAKEEAAEIITPQKKEKWTRTRYCACSPTAVTDCRFHSPSEKGWETCPQIPAGWQGEEKQALRHGKWLYSAA